MTSSEIFVAVDLGASSGRIHVGRVSDTGLEVEEIHRFRNGGVDVLGHLHWDVLALHREILEGLRRAANRGPVLSVGIDSWAADYGLLDSAGELIGNPYHYRDRRTQGVPEGVLARLGATELYRRNGIVPLDFNTVFQLIVDDKRAAAASLLLIPDLMAYWLTGQQRSEITNASTTGLLAIPDDGPPAWDQALMAELGIPAALFTSLVLPGQNIGDLLPQVASATELPASTRVIAVGSHDTASAVAGVPASHRPFAYISSGTWSLLGVELDQPVRTEGARMARFTNEFGVDGTVRFLRNIMGLWLLQECQRSWHVTRAEELSALLAAAAALPARRWLIDVDDPDFLYPGAMPERLAVACARRGGSSPMSPAEMTRAILDSLAVAYRRALDDVRRLTGRPVEVLHVVGGGAQNKLLCQLTADACGLAVIAGPVEAAAAGNLVIQARAHGTVDGELSDLRLLIGGGLHTYEPREPSEPWAEAAAILAEHVVASPVSAG